MLKNRYLQRKKLNIKYLKMTDEELTENFFKDLSEEDKKIFYKILSGTEDK